MAPVCQKACLGLKNNAFSHFILSASWLKIATPSSEWLWLVAVCAVFFLVLCFFFSSPLPRSFSFFLQLYFFSPPFFLIGSMAGFPDHWGAQSHPSQMMDTGFMGTFSGSCLCATDATFFPLSCYYYTFCYILIVPAMINVSVSMLIFVLANTVPCRNVSRCV